MAERPEPQQPEQTTDLHAASPSTARRVDTSGFSVDPQLERTGDFVDAGDASSMTGGYTPSDMPNRIAGTPIVPGFEILDELGRGGMGVVYKARQVALDRVVALKMILAGAHARDKDLVRFQAEARAVGQFQHPNIVQIFEVGEAGGLPYFSLEYVAEGSLSHKINRDPQPPRYSAEIVEALARAMHYAHERGIIHRDLKPANVLLASDGAPKITDFGLAKQLDRDSGQTQAGQVLGTPSYMAPEQAYGDSDKITAAADIYALGGILYDLLTGRPPFSGTSVIETLEMVRTREPVPPSQLAARLPRDLETITLKCLQKDPVRRYSTAGALADDLRRFLDGRPILARPVGSFEKAWRWAKRNPWLAGLGTSVALLLVAVAVVTSAMSYRLSIKKKEADEARENETNERIKAQNALIKEEIAKQQAKASAVVAAKRGDVALDTVRAVLRDVDNQMRNSMSLAPLRRRIVDTMLAKLSAIRSTALNNPLEDRTEALAYARIADIYSRVGRIAEASVWLKKAYPVLQKLADEHPDDPTALFNLSAIENQIADAEWRLGSSDRAHRLYEEALKVRQERVSLLDALVTNKKASGNDLVNAQNMVAEQFGLVAFSHLRLGNLDEAIKNYQESDRAFAALPAGAKGSLPMRRMRAEIQVRLGEATLRQGKPKVAEKHFQAALDERKELVRLTPRPPEYNALVRSDLAQSQMLFGDYRLMGLKDAAAAMRDYEAALAINERLLEGNQDNLEFQRAVATCQYRLGYVADKQNGLAALSGAAVPVAESRSCFAASLELAKKLAQIDPKDTHGQISLMLAQAPWPGCRRRDSGGRTAQECRQRSSDFLPSRVRPVDRRDWDRRSGQALP